MSRSRSSSHSPARHRERSPDRSHRRHRDDARPRKREKSRSRERPRKRRSTSEEERPTRRRSRSVDHGDDRHGRRDRYRERDGKRDHRRPPRSRSPHKHSPKPFQRSKRPLPSQNDAFQGEKEQDSPGPEKQKPNFRPSGLLAAASNTVSTSSGNIVLKYHEPAEARKPPSSQTWRLYIFKGEEILDTLELYSQSCWLFGREVSVCDYALEHPSCSKQHAVVQFRYVEKRNEFGDKVGKVKPYVIDLESGNGTKVNDEVLPAGRYFELRNKDVIKFGHSTREYVVQLPPA